MRKRIAVFAGGWSGEFLQEVLGGIKSEAQKRDTDVFAFVNFSITTTNEELNSADVNLFRLPDFTDYDGIIFLANSFNSAVERQYLEEEIAKHTVPAVTIECELGGLPYIATDNYNGMYDLANHMFKEHGVKSVVFVGGPQDHPESRERLRALCDVAKENDVEIPEKNILYADWGKVMIPELLDNWLMRKENAMPDVFICANDIMAMAVCMHLKTLGWNVPKDVLVTGYDCIRLARTFEVPITSVNHRWNELGSSATNVLFDVMNGKKVEQHTMQKTSFSIGASCGCTEGFLNMQDNESFGRKVVIHNLDPIAVDSHFRHFYSSIRKVRSKADLVEKYSELFESDHKIEGDYFGIFIDPRFFEASDDKVDLLEYGHRNYYDLICGLEHGLVVPEKTVTKKDMIFGASESNPNPDLYMFMVLSSETYTYGYVMMNTSNAIANENQYYIWTRHMDQALDQVQNNLVIENMHKKLLHLSVTDALTNSYNRMGCETVIYPELIQAGKQGTYSTVMLIDVDKLKQINDKYGHIKGDHAIRLVADTLMMNLPKQFKVARFGGDEFFVGGIVDKTNEELDTLVEKLENSLNEAAREAGLSYPLFMSIGYARLRAESVSDIERGIAQSDEMLYKAKDIHHKRLEEFYGE